MRIGETAVIFDAPFYDLFQLSPRRHIFSQMNTWGFNAASDPHGSQRIGEASRTGGVSSRYREDPCRRAASRRPPREIIIPIDIDMDDSPEECCVIYEKPQHMHAGSGNQNNNGTHVTRMRSSRNRTEVIRESGKLDRSKNHESAEDTSRFGCSSSPVDLPLYRGSDTSPSESSSESGGTSEYAGTPPGRNSQPDVGTSNPSSSKGNPEHLPDSSETEVPSISKPPGYAVYRHLKPRLMSDGRQVDYIKADGNCFFRALSKEIYGSEKFHDDIRQAVVDFVEKYSNDFKPFLFSETSISDHIMEMRKASTWASTVEIYAAATLLQRDIYVLSPDHTGDLYNWLLFSPRFIYNQAMSYHPCHITLCHTHGNHYDRIAQIEGDCNCGVEPPTLAGSTDYMDLTLDE